ncbi:MAG: hypothetical protein HYT11_04170 [Candidatus Levybacteria bacterium]|nr:hypothetical protein [Candidatus Levybacteria bacterium]
MSAIERGKSINQEHIVVVFWNPDEPYTHAETTMHSVKGDVDPVLLMHDGQTIAEFFKNRSISIETVRDLFPYHLISETAEVQNNKSIMAKLSGLISSHHTEQVSDWDVQLIRQSLPMDKEGLQKLADLVGIPVSAYTYLRGTNEIPGLYLEVVPHATK